MNGYFGGQILSLRSRIFSQIDRFVCINEWSNCRCFYIRHDVNDLIRSGCAKLSVVRG